MRKEQKNTDFHMRMSKEEKDELEMYSYLDDVTTSEYVRKALQCYMNMHRYVPEQLKEWERMNEKNAAKTKR